MNKRLNSFNASPPENITLGLPIKFSQTPGKVRTGAPRYGEHTGAVLRAYGFGDNEIAALRKEGAIAAADFAEDKVG